MLNDRSKEQVRLLRESLESLNRPYEYLIDEFLPEAVDTLMRQVGITEYSLKRKVNFSLSEAIKLNKTCSYHYHLTLNYGGKSKTFRLIEIPKLHRLGYGVVNGVQRVFNIKLKRSNFSFYYDREAGIIYLNLNNLRNKSFRLVYRIGTAEVEINYDKQAYDLTEFLLRFYSKGSVIEELYKDTESRSVSRNYSNLRSIRLDHDRILSRTGRLDRSIISDIDFIVSSKNSRMLSRVIGRPLDSDYRNFLTLTNVLNILNWLVDPNNLGIIDQCQKNLLNKEWQTVGGYLKDIIERAWFNTSQNDKTRELILRAIEEGQEDLNGFIHKLILANLNLSDLRLRIHIYLHDGSFSQLMESLNPLAILINIRKVSLIYRGLISKRTATNEMRSLNPYLQGRTCSITTSESSVIGLIKHLTLGVIMNEHEELLIPYYRVRKGNLIDSQILRLNFYEEQDKNITDWLNWSSGRSILKVRRNDIHTLCRREEVDLVYALPGQNASWGVNLLAYSNHSEPDRLLMGANMLRQALVLKYPRTTRFENSIYAPLISYYLEQFLPDNGKVRYLSSKFLLRSRTDEGTELVSYRDLQIRSECFDFFDNSHDRSGNFRITTHSTRDGLTLGNTVRCAYGLWGGYNYEDALVISDRLVRDELFSSVHMETITVPVFRTLAGDEVITKDAINLFKYDLKNIDDRGVIRVGSHVKSGDILVMKVKPIKRKEYTPEQRLLFSILGEKNLSVKNNFFRLPNQISEAWVYSVDYVRGRCTEDQFSLWADVMEAEHDTEMRDLLRNYALKDYPREDPEILIRNWLSKPRSRPEEVKVIVDYFKRLNSILRNSISKEDCLFMVNVNLIREKPLRVGDKLTGMHGNKGVVSRIVPECDMPFDESGNTIDIIISNLSVYGRLNLSQLKESFLTGLSEHMRLVLLRLREGMRAGIEPDTEQIRVLQDIFNFNDLGDWLDGIDLGDNGFRLDATPFSEPSDAIDRLSRVFHYSEMRRLRCGQTGEFYNRPSHVGYMYILKLKHTVDTKFNARSIGSSSLKINQPTRGRMRSNVSDFITEGQAQKIGTMEKDALIARGTPRFLRELFTFRSDLINFRRKVLNGQIFLDPEFDTNILPEATKVFVRYLACLGIRLDITQEDARLSLYSDRDLLSLSKGEVRVADTYHYKTRKVIPSGLYCTKIFGSDKNVSCECEKYVGNRYMGLVCPQCGVLVTTNEERRDFFGHVTLGYPVINLQLFKQLMKLFKMDYPVRRIRGLVNFTSYLWIKSDGTETFIDEWKHVDDGSVLSGAEALIHVISKIDLSKNYRECLVMHYRQPDRVIWSDLFQAHKEFVNSGNRLSDIIVRHVLILPKVLRPLIFNPNGSYISSDIVNSILTLIRRNNRLIEFKHYGILPFILEKMKTMLQEAVNMYLWGMDSQDNVGSIVHALKGKMGLARKYLLAKRINNSARSVLVQNPLLPLSKCRVPLLILKKIFLPLIQRKMVEKNYAVDFFEAFEILSGSDYDEDMVRRLINELVREVPIVLNRNPTLHSLSMQAFYAEPVEHQAIEVNPLTLKAFAGDIDGDQIAVTLAIGDDTIREIRERMINHNTYNVSDGKIVTILLKELGMAVYLLTLDDSGNDDLWLTDNQLEIYRGKHSITSRVTWFKGDGKRVRTTLGRAYLIRFLEKTLGRYLRNEELINLNRPWTKDILEYVYSLLTLFRVNYHRVNEFCDRLKLISNEYSYSHNCSFSLEEIAGMESSWDRDTLHENILEVESLFGNGDIDSDERTRRLVTIWRNAESDILDRTIAGLEGTQHRLVIDSRFRGGNDTIMSMSNARGLISLKREYLIPVTSSLYRGYDGMEFCNLSNIIDKLIVKSLGTAKGGYFNRQMVEILRDSPVAGNDCGDDTGVPFDVSELKRNFGIYIGRILARDLDQISLKRGSVLSYEDLMNIRLTGGTVYLRSPITCRYSRGICRKCFGLKVDTARLPEFGESVGVLAAHAMTEPVTQTLLQTKHLRYIQLESNDPVSTVNSDDKGYAHFTGNTDDLVRVDRGLLYLSNDPAKIRIGSFEYSVTYGTVLTVNPGSPVNEGDALLLVNEQPCIYAHTDCRLDEQNTKHTDLRSFVIRDLKGNIVRHLFLRNDSFSLESKDGESNATYRRGDLIFKLNMELANTERTLDDAFNDLVRAMIKINTYYYRNAELFDIHAPFAGKVRILNDSLIISCPKGRIRKWNLPSALSYFSLNLFGKDLMVAEGDLLFRGKYGVHPLDTLYSGKYVDSALYFLNLIRDIYGREDIRMLSVYLELFVREFYLLGSVKGSSNVARSWRYLSERFRVRDIVPFIRRSLKEAYIDNVSPLSIIVYENVVKNMIREASMGSRDRLVSVHSKLVLGRIIPIMDCFDPVKWFDTYDLRGNPERVDSIGD